MPELSPKQYAMSTSNLLCCSSADLVAAGYTSCHVKQLWSTKSYLHVINLIIELFGDDYVFWTDITLFWFKTKEDAVMFKLMYNG